MSLSDTPLTRIWRDDMVPASQQRLSRTVAPGITTGDRPTKNAWYCEPCGVQYHNDTGPWPLQSFRYEASAHPATVTRASAPNGPSGRAGGNAVAGCPCDRRNTYTNTRRGIDCLCFMGDLAVDNLAQRSAVATPTVVSIHFAGLAMKRLVVMITRAPSQRRRSLTRPTM